MDEDREPPEEPDATADEDASGDDARDEGDAAGPASDGSDASDDDARDDAPEPSGEGADTPEPSGDGDGAPATDGAEDPPARSDAGDASRESDAGGDGAGTAVDPADGRDPSDESSPADVPSLHSPGSGPSDRDDADADAENPAGNVDEAIVADGEVDDEAIEAQIGVMENEGADEAGSSAYPDFAQPPEFESETVESPRDDPDLAAAADDFGGFDGPQSDEEMPLADHIEEMLKRLAVVVAVAGLVSIVTFPFAERIINFLWYSVLPGVPSDIARPRVYGILELKLTELKVASLAGLIVALPVVVYETYQFMRPGLYPNERRYYLAAIPTSLVLALVGVSFAYFIVLPAIFSYFLYYSQDVANIGFALGKTFNLILVLMGYLALVFQIPLFIMLAMMMGLVTRRWLAARRLLFWGAFLGISFIFSPDPTGMAPIIIALTMIVLFEGTLLLTKWTGRG